MSFYRESCFNPYRENLWEESIKIIEEDIDKICSTLQSRGLLFFTAFLVLMPITLLKVITHVHAQLKKPVWNYDYLKLTRDKMDKETITQLLTRRESCDKVQNIDNYNPNIKKKEERANKINTLRMYLYKHDLKLRGYILKTINHKLTEEELLQLCRTGEVVKPMTTTRVTFGYDIDYLLKEVLGDKIDLQVRKLTGETSIKIVNYDFQSIGDALSNLYNEDVQVIFDDTQKN